MVRGKKGASAPPQFSLRFYSKLTKTIFLKLRQIVRMTEFDVAAKFKENRHLRNLMSDKLLRTHFPPSDPNPGTQDRRLRMQRRPRLPTSSGRSGPPRRRRLPRESRSKFFVPPQISRGAVPPGPPKKVLAAGLDGAHTAMPSLCRPASRRRRSSTPKKTSSHRSTE